MAKIFISHADENDTKARALQSWLVLNGWNDLFRAADEHYGLKGGVEWQPRIVTEIELSKAMLCLISEAWLDSKECHKELAHAYSMGKIVFGVIIEQVLEDRIPKQVSAARQLTDLASGQDHVGLSVVRPGGVQEKTTFSESGLNHLKAGLVEAGVDKGSFAWPPPSDPDRAPYRGMASFEAEDAGIYFGRDADIAKLLSRMREAHDRGVSKLIPILGASGAGKSSFLRAGILPRLERDAAFLVFPLIRPLSAAISGQHGFEAALHAFGSTSETKVAKADIKNALANGSDDVVRLFLDIFAGSAPLRNKTLVVAIDQAEELLRDDEDGENKLLMGILGAMLNSAHLRCVVLLCMRIDAHTSIQAVREFGHDEDPFSFQIMAPGAYSAVIEGPARVTKTGGRPLTIEPEVTDKLLRDIDEAQSKDGLPLLALTLERLYRYRDKPDKISLSDYELDGGIANAVEASVKNALQPPDGREVVRGSPAEKWDLVRRTFIPWLIEVDSESNKAFRRISSKSEIPQACHDVVDVLVNQRLLTVDAGESQGAVSGPPTIEITHEALIRQWPRMGVWIEENQSSLKVVDEVRRAANLWAADRKPTERLAHSGERLRLAMNLLNSEWQARFRPVDAEYLAQCDKAETLRAADEERSHRVIKTLKRTAFAVASVFLFSMAVGLVVLKSQNDALIGSNARFAISASTRLFDDGRMEEGVLLLLQAAEVFPPDQQPIGVRTGLQRYVDFTANSITFALPEGEIWKVRAPGLVIEDSDNSLLRFVSSIGEAWAYKGTSAKPIVALQINGAQDRLYLARADGLLEVLDVKRGSLVSKFALKDVDNLQDIDVDLTTDGYAFVQIKKDPPAAGFYVYDLNTGVSTRIAGEAIDKVRQDGALGNILATDKGLFRVRTEAGHIKLSPLKLTDSELASANLRDCFVKMGDDPAEVVTDMDFESPNLIESECRRTGNQVILSKTMWNSAGGKRSDTMKQLDDEDDFYTRDVKDRIGSLFGKYSTEQNMSWLDQTKSGYVGAIFNRDLFVFNDGGAVLNLRYGAGISWAAFSGEHYLSVVDARLGIVRTYDLSKFTTADQGADQEENSSAAPEVVDDASVNSCSLWNSDDYVYSDESISSAKVEIRAVTRNTEESSNTEITATVGGRAIPLSRSEQNEQRCIQVQRNWPYLVLTEPGEDGAKIFKLESLAKGSIEDSQYWRISDRLASLSVTAAGEILTTGYSHTVEVWRPVMDGWEKDDLPLLTSDNEIQYAEMSPSGRALLVIEDTGQRMLKGSVYALGETPLFWKDLGREYKFFSGSFLDENTVLALYNGSEKTFILEDIPKLKDEARRTIPQVCMVGSDYAKSRCWPKELKPI